MSVTFEKFPVGLEDLSVVGEVDGCCDRYSFEAVLSQRIEHKSFRTDKSPDGTHVVKLWITERNNPNSLYFEFIEGGFSCPEPDEDSFGAWDMVFEVVDAIEESLKSAPLA